MKYSRNNNSSRSVITSTGVERDLDQTYINKLDMHYKHSVAGYSDIVKEYKEECNRARKAVEKSLWDPPERELSSNERILLMGPPSSATFYKRLSVRDPASNRLIHYTIRPVSKISQCDSSFVCLKDDSGYFHPQFGSVVSLFAHTFSETSYWAELDLFSQAIMMRIAKCGLFLQVYNILRKLSFS